MAKLYRRGAFSQSAPPTPSLPIGDGLAVAAHEPDAPESGDASGEAAVATEEPGPAVEAQPAIRPGRVRCRVLGRIVAEGHDIDGHWREAWYMGDVGDFTVTDVMSVPHLFTEL